MSCSKGPVLLHEFFHRLAIRNSFLTVRNPWQKICIRSRRFMLLILFTLFFFNLRNKNVFHKFSVSFPFFEGFFPKHLFKFFLLFSFLLLLFYKLKPHVLLIVRHVSPYRFSSLFLYLFVPFFHLNISSLVIFNLPKVYLILFLDNLFLLFDLAGLLRQFFTLLQYLFLLFELLNQPITLLFDKPSFFSFSFLFLEPCFNSFTPFFFYSLSFFSLLCLPLLFLLLD